MSFESVPTFLVDSDRRRPNRGGVKAQHGGTWILMAGYRRDRAALENHPRLEIVSEILNGQQRYPVIPTRRGSGPVVESVPWNRSAVSTHRSFRRSGSKPSGSLSDSDGFSEV